MAKKTNEERERDFYQELVPFLQTNPTDTGKYSKEMLRAFYEYFSEWNKSNTKMKWELEKTWQLSKRLSRWARNDKSFNKQKEQPTATYKDLSGK